jgi:hypothetical protein
MVAFSRGLTILKYSHPELDALALEKGLLYTVPKLDLEIGQRSHESTTSSRMVKNRSLEGRKDRPWQ